VNAGVGRRPVSAIDAEFYNLQWGDLLISPFHTHHHRFSAALLAFVTFFFLLFHSLFTFFFLWAYTFQPHTKCYSLANLLMLGLNQILRSKIGSFYPHHQFIWIKPNTNAKAM